MVNDPTLLSISEASKQIEAGELSPVDLVELLLNKIKQHDGKLNTFVTIVPELVKKAAKEAETEIRAGKYRGPLHGIPIGIKDIIDTKGIVTTIGSSIFKENIPNQDATVVKRLTKAGAVLIGKTNTHEFALGVTTNNLHYGPTRNPWDLERVPGGSSGGSAAATAANLCFAALGSDSGGSVRIPSAFCGIVGLKPTYGRVSLHGVFPLATSLDHVGSLTRTVEDAAILLQEMAGFDEDDPRSLLAPVPNYRDSLADASVEGLKIVVSEDIDKIPVDSNIIKAFRAIISKIEKLGGEINEIKLPFAKTSEEVSSIILLAEAATQHAELLAEHSDQYGRNVIDRFRAGQKIQTDAYIKATRNREVIIREFELLFQRVDFYLTPTVQILPPKIGQEVVKVDSTEVNVVLGCTQFTRLGNLTGMPVIALPWGFSTNSLPLSIQFMAPKLGEPELLKLAYALEQHIPEHTARTLQY
jgi:aspartyl-tRNA(Asn)/glutamyl-tRNA(Gln) amidotransferase subunit A